MLLVFIGPPGSGKGTQAAFLAQHLNLAHLSTGEILRQAKRDGSRLGMLAAPLMDSGELVPDDLMVQLVAERIDREDCQDGFLLDGFPRTLVQARSLDPLLEERGRQLDGAIELRVSDAEVTRRLIERASRSPDPRPEDRAAAIPRRLELYLQETQPLLDYYASRNLLLTVDGTGTPEQVSQRILQKLGAKNVRR